MFSEIMSLALGNGLWAALFCLLFLYQLKDSRAREKKYTLTINSLTQSLSSVKDIKKDCETIKTDCKEILTDCKEIRTDFIALKTGLAVSRRMRSVMPDKKRANSPEQEDKTEFLAAAEKTEDKTA